MQEQGIVGKELFCNRIGKCKVLDRVDSLVAVDWNKKEYAATTQYLVKKMGVAMWH